MSKDDKEAQTTTGPAGTKDVSGDTETVSGKPEEKSTTGEPSGEVLVDGLNLKTLPKQYKDLQREYNRIQNEVVKKFEAFGGAEQVLQWTQYLSNNPDFAQWVASQRNKTALGIDESTLDDSTKAALSTVRKIAKSVVEEEVGRVRQELQPITEAQKEEILARHFDDMDAKYGDSWHEMRDLMSELSEDLPEKVQDRPKFDDVEDLYFKALRKSGKLEAYAAKQYEKKLTDKKAKSTTKPASPGESTPQRAKNMSEAFELAKQAQ